MEPLAQLLDERDRLEAELLTIEQAIEGEQRHLKPGVSEAEDEVIGLLKMGFDSHLARLQAVNEQLAQMRR